jgi:hypothetical protein
MDEAERLPLLFGVIAFFGGTERDRRPSLRAISLADLRSADETRRGPRLISSTQRQIAAK